MVRVQFRPTIGRRSSSDESQFSRCDNALSCIKEGRCYRSNSGEHLVRGEARYCDRTAEDVASVAAHSFDLSSWNLAVRRVREGMPNFAKMDRM